MDELRQNMLEGFCPHGNYPDTCAACNDEAATRGRQNDKRKPERVKEIFSSRALERRRFLLSRNSEVRKNLENFRDMYQDIKDNHPGEVVSMVLGGSHVKGYATSESDFDSILYIDSEEAVRHLDIDDLKPEDAVTAEDIQFLKDNLKAWYTTIDDPDPVAAAQDKSKLTREAVLMKYTKLIKQGLQNHGLGGQDRHISVAIHLLDKQEILQFLRSERYATNAVVSLFELSLDRDINKWREIVIAELERQPDGQQKWQTIMDELGEKERLEIHDTEILGPITKPERHKGLYPTLERARQYFLPNQRKESEG